MYLRRTRWGDIFRAYNKNEGMMNQYKHWEVLKDEDRILWIGFNRQDKIINVINNEVLDELNSLLQEITQDSQITGVIIYSSKNTQDYDDKSKIFIAGADIDEF